MLSQHGPDGREHPVAYFSKKLLSLEERYATVEKGVLPSRSELKHFVCTC